MKLTKKKNKLSLIKSQIHDTFKCEIIIMEADITSQAVGLSVKY